jgi:hypothetical protein
LTHAAVIVFPATPSHRVVLSSTALLPFLSVRKAAALAIAQSGVAAFFIAGVTWSALGASAGWFVLAVTVLDGPDSRDRHRELGAAHRRRLRQSSRTRIWRRRRAVCHCRCAE